MEEHYTPELIKLANGLIERGIKFEFCPMPIFHGGQILGNHWDAVCHDASYGRESGLLEIMGSLVDPNCTDSVEGFLTAQEILDRLDKMERSVSK